MPDREAWAADLGRVNAAIPPEAIVTFDDDTQSIDPEWANAHPEVVRVQQRLLQVGYANGYL